MIPKKLLDEIKHWMDEGRYGNIQINFSGGKIINYNITQSLKVDFVISRSDCHAGDVKVDAIAYQEKDL